MVILLHWPFSVPPSRHFTDNYSIIKMQTKKKKKVMDICPFRVEGFLKKDGWGRTSHMRGYVVWRHGNLGCSFS